MTTFQKFLAGLGTLIGIIVLVVGIGYLMDKDNSGDLSELKVQTEGEIDKAKVDNMGAYERNNRPGEYTFIGKGPAGMNWVFIGPDGKVYNPPIPKFQDSKSSTKTRTVVINQSQPTQQILPPNINIDVKVDGKQDQIQKESEPKVIEKEMIKEVPKEEPKEQKSEEEECVDEERKGNKKQINK